MVSVKKGIGTFILIIIIVFIGINVYVLYTDEKNIHLSKNKENINNYQFFIQFEYIQNNITHTFDYALFINNSFHVNLDGWNTTVHNNIISFTSDRIIIYNTLYENDTYFQQDLIIKNSDKYNVISIRFDQYLFESKTNIILLRSTVGNLYCYTKHTTAFHEDYGTQDITFHYKLIIGGSMTDYQCYNPLYDDLLRYFLL